MLLWHWLSSLHPYKCSASGSQKMWHGFQWDMAGIVVKKQDNAAILKHYNEVPEVLPISSQNTSNGNNMWYRNNIVTTNWWTYLVRRVPLSSALVERLFSMLGKMFTSDRYQLTDKIFEQLIFYPMQSCALVLMRTHHNDGFINYKYVMKLSFQMYLY